MKRIFIGITFTLLASAIYSQQYVTFPMQDALWTYRIVGSMNPPYEWTHIDSLGGIIAIDTVQYISVYEEDYLKGGIREDSAEKKIFFNDYSQEIVLYDFSLSVGDTIFYPTPLDNYKVVMNIDSVMVAGQYRKRFQLINALYDMPDTWIVGIGSVYRYGLMNPYYPWIVLDGSTPYFGCFSHDTVVYMDDANCYGSCPCDDWLVGIEESGNEQGVSVFFDADIEILNVKIPQGIVQSTIMEIIDCKGQLIKKIIPVSEESQIDIDILSKGIYLLNVNNAEIGYTYKFCKMF